MRAILQTRCGCEKVTTFPDRYPRPAIRLPLYPRINVNPWPIPNLREISFEYREFVYERTLGLDNQELVVLYVEKDSTTP